jgi:subtilisin family serine protease
LHRPVFKLPAFILLIILLILVGNLSAPRAAATSIYTLRLGEISFDGKESPPNLPAGWDKVSITEPDLHLVQFTGPTDANWLTALENSNLQVIQYIHPFTYVVWGQNVADAVSADSTLTTAVRWTGPFAPAYRVLPKWHNLGSQAVDVDVLMYRGADTDLVVRSIQTLGAQERGRAILNNTWEIAGFTISGDLFQTAAQIPGVYSIQPVPTDGGLRGEMSNQINVGNYDNTNAAFPGYAAWLTAAGVDGSGVIIANVDGGVQETHPDLTNRMISCTGVTCSGANSGHGTHTAGIMAADGASGTLDSFGFLRGQGMAPGANLFEQVYSPWYQQPGGMLLLMTDSFNNGASLSGNSWGPAGTPQGYDDDTLQVDIGVRDSDPGAAGNQPLSFVLSFMNGSGGTSTQGSPDEAKNLFNIGSTKMQTGSGSQILDIDDLSANTAHGPALDGRTIPHMVAPGCEVDSTVTGSSYDLLCGTSMASPHVSGAVALFIEYYRNLTTPLGFGPADPSPALIKAAFLPVAHDLAGFDDADGNPLGHPFDNKQGWGRMDTAAVISPTASVRYFDNPVIFDNTGEEWIQTVSPADPSKPIKIMLVWTDAPGHGLGGSTPAWNNDLDLVVEVGGDTYLGNNFDGSGWSQTGGSADGMNNTEGVFLGPTAPGSAVIRVQAANINSDGIPNQGDTTDQDFALACYNCALEPDFSIIAGPSPLDVCAPDDAVYNLTIHQIANYNDSVTLSASGNPAGTTADFSNNPVTPPDTSTLTIGNTGAASAGHYDLDIVGVATTRTHTTTVGLDLYDAVPGTVTLITPTNGTVDTDLAPAFEWSTSTQNQFYILEVAGDMAFSNIVYSATLETTTHTAETQFESETTYYWRVRSGNSCGEGSNSAVFEFTTRPIPPVLVVDDDDNDPDVRSFYTNALDTIGLEYDIWDTNNSDNEPGLSLLAPYEMVIWFTGAEFGGAAGPGSTGEVSLEDWLDNGGCFFISSQDYIFDRGGLTPFMTNYLGAGSFSGDGGGYSAVNGQGSVFGGLGPFTLNYPYTDYSDELNPGGSAETAFIGTNAVEGAVNKDNGTYRTAFLSFPFDVIVGEANRVTVLQAFTDWCSLEAQIGTLEISENTIEETVDMGSVVTRTLVVSNTGNAAFDFTVSEGAAWAEVSPTGGTLNPGQSTDLSVVFDSSQTAGAGTYSDTLTFDGNYDNDPADVSLILHVNEPPDATHYIFLPAIVGDGGTGASQTNAAPALLPFLGLVALGTGWLTKRSRKTKK